METSNTYNINKQNNKKNIEAVQFILNKTKKWKQRQNKTNKQTNKHTNKQTTNPKQTNQQK